MCIGVAVPEDYKLYSLLKLYIDELDHGIIITNNSLNILYLNIKSKNLLNLDTTKCYLGEKIHEVINVDFLENKDIFKNIFETGIPKIFNTEMIKEDFNNCYLKITINKIEKYIIIKIYDKTSDKKIRFELEHTQQQLKSTIKCLNLIKKEERTIIGQTIHDDIGQSLTALKYKTYNLTDKLKKNCSPYAVIAEELISSIDYVATSIRGITSKLIPSIFDNELLSKRVYYKVSEFKNISSINFCVTIKPDNLDIRNEDSEDLLKILQEALTNAVTHSKATQVKVKLQKMKDHVELTIKDDGIGISKSEINSINSYGLRGMFMRCEKKNRKLLIRGNPNTGTTIKALFYFCYKNEEHQ